MPETRDEQSAGIDAPPFLPELVADMWALGCSPNLVVDLLRPLRLSPDRTRVVDLGCGKGALGITLAERLGFRVYGVDLCEAFLHEATRRATEHGVRDRCDFERRDLRDVASEGAAFDVALLASLGGVLGKPDRCVGSLREVVRPRGYMVIDGGFLKRVESVDRPGYGHYMSLERTLAGFTTHGDTLVEQRTYTAEETRVVNEDYIHHIKRRAAELAQRHPETGHALRTYVASQESECEFIDREISRAIWLLQRAADPHHATQPS